MSIFASSSNSIREIGAKCKTNADCKGFAVLCNLDECGCNLDECGCRWTTAMSGERCESMTPASILPAVCSVYATVALLACLLYACRVLCTEAEYRRVAR